MTTQSRTAHGMRIFSIIWFGQLISTLGSGLSGFALGVWIYETTSSTTLFALSMVIWILPNILLSPVAGVIADRWDRRLIMILIDSMAGLATLFIWVTLTTGSLQVWHVYIAQAFFSSANTFQWPTYSAATSLLVPKEHLGRAGGMTQVGEAISSLASPAAAGALYVTTGMKTIILIDITTYLFALATLVAVRFPRLETTEEGRAGQGSFFQEALYGWKYIYARRGLLGLLIVFAVLNFLINLTGPLFTPMILDMTTPDVLGYVSSVMGLGMLVGTLTMSIWGGPKRRIYGIFTFETLAGLCIMLLGLRSSIPLIAVAGFGMALVMPITNACSQAIWQSKVAQDVQGRVFSARRMIAFSIIPFSYILSGPLADTVFDPLLVEGGALASSVGRLIGVGDGRGTGLMFVILGLLYVLSAQAILLHPRIRRLELELPDAVPAQDEDEDEAVPAESPVVVA